MIKSVEAGGADGLRIEGVYNIAYSRKATNLPIIGLIKDKSIVNSNRRYITKDMDAIINLINTPCNYIAIEMTAKPYENTKFFKDAIELVQMKGKKVIADIGTLEEAIVASKLGADYIATTMAGHRTLWLTQAMKTMGIDNIIAEGSINNHSDYKRALEFGAKIVVVGTAITRPEVLTRRIKYGKG
jgi:N-acylglucosamine-6-phosphate 2-epimerase